MNRLLLAWHRALTTDARRVAAERLLEATWMADTRGAIVRIDSATGVMCVSAGDHRLAGRSITLPGGHPFHGNSYLSLV